MDIKQSRPETVEEYIARFPEHVQQILVKIRAVVKEAAPAAEERISYNMPAYFLNGRLIYYDAHKHHVGFYPLTPAMEEALPELAAYKGTKSSLHFRLDQPIPYDLIARLVRVRVVENTKK